MAKARRARRGSNLRPKKKKEEEAITHDQQSTNKGKYDHDHQSNLRDRIVRKTIASRTCIQGLVVSRRGGDHKKKKSNCTIEYSLTNCAYLPIF